MTTIERKCQAIDVDAALAKVGEDWDLLGELAELFCQECPKLLSVLRRAIAASDAPATRSAAHSLKGSVAVFSANQATALVVRLEDRARAGQLTSAAETLTELEAELEKVCGDLRLVASTDAPRNTGTRSAGERKEIS